MRKGFSLLELLLTIALIGLLSFLSGYFGSAFFDDYKLENNKSRLISDLFSARIKAFLKNTTETVVFNNNKYVNSNSIEVKLGNDFYFEPANFNIFFNKFGGCISSVNFKLKMSSGKEIIFTINKMGFIEWEKQE